MEVLASRVDRTAGSYHANREGMLALLAQLVHHFRHELARHPQLGPVVSGVYGLLGIPLAPDWNPAAYDVQQWGAVSDPAKAGTLRVRATLVRASRRHCFPACEEEVPVHPRDGGEPHDRYDNLGGGHGRAVAG